MKALIILHLNFHKKSYLRESSFSLPIFNNHLTIWFPSPLHGKLVGSGNHDSIFSVPLQHHSLVHSRSSIYSRQLSDYLEIRTGFWKGKKIRPKGEFDIDLWHPSLLSLCSSFPPERRSHSPGHQQKWEAKRGKGPIKARHWLLELGCTSLWESIMSKFSELHVQWHNIGSLKLAMWEHSHHGN